MKARMNPRGFTLTEALMVGVLAAIIGGLFIPFLRVHGIVLTEGTANNKMQMQSDIVTGDIARKIRAANRVMAAGESWSAAPSLAQRSINEIILYDGTGSVTAAYQISGGRLNESTDGINYGPYKTGGDTVFTATGSIFSLSPKRNEVTIWLKMALLYRGTTYQTMAMGNLYQCRN